ncbi:Hypothetical protein NCS54_00203800 [Fusarium falciforme]|uniref:Hypothetical protein n=1 Tax=Fusarium falciforme TaxID=195108 RepID=UPI002300043D|nr:Hypothetical protein NCS54_00203800 [Fusarium falciforme]WAO84810.1 Hypothetical protein NCS54_00203800 [Fusarium falciforme]
MAQTAESPSIDGFLQDPRFHHSFMFPVNPSEGENQMTLQVKYVDFGYRNDANPEEENVLLFFPPLMGSRLLHITKDDLAKRHKVRFISLDRPGFGGTAEVALEKRASISREMILALLKHLGIKHVSVACHSGGTVYAFDMLLHHPEILHPDRPYFAIAAPWILPSHSHVLSMTLTQAIPNSVMAHTDKVIGFVNSTLLPVISTSTGFSQTFVNLTKSSQPDASGDPDAKFEESLAQKQFKLIHSENIRGMSHESIFLMQKIKEVDGWGDWRDYDDLKPKLVEALKRTTTKPLTMDVFFAEKDHMVGDAAAQGPEWFEKCWNAEEAKDVISYSSTVLSGADHETAWSIGLGVPKRVFERISGRNA